MAVAFSASAYTEGAATNSISATLPANSAGNLLVLLCSWGTNSPTTFNTPSGYTQIFNLSPGSFDNVIAAFWKISSGSESSPTVSVSSGSDDIACIAMCFTGTHATTPIDVSATSSAGGGSNWTSPSVTTTVANTLLVGGGMANGASNYSSSNPGAMALIHQDTTDGSWLGAAYESVVATGATDTRTWTNAANAKGSFSFAIAPSAGGAADITSVTGPASAANTIRATESSAISGTGFEASQSTGAATLAGVAVTETAWSDTSITITGPTSGLMFGGSKTLTVTPATNTADSIASQSYLPPTGYSYVTYDGSTVTANSVFWDGDSAVAGLATGDQAYFSDIATRVGGSETCTFSVADGTGIVTLTGVTEPGDYSNATVKLRDASDGTDSSAYTVTVDATAPTVASATIDATGLVLTIELTENAVIGAGGSGGITLSGQYGAITATYDSTSTVNVLFDLSRTAYDNEALTVNYTQPTAGITDDVGNELASFTGQAVTNNSAEAQPAGTAGAMVTSMISNMVANMTGAIS